MIELYQLEQFVCIAENKTLSHAAEKLGISQPALTRSMQKLEQDLDVQLFDHYKNKIILNQNGMLALKHAKSILNKVSKMKQEVQTLDRSLKSITIASCTPAPIWDIQPLLTTQFGKLNFQTEIVDEKNLVPMLKSRKANMIITPFEVKDPSILCEHYLDEEIYLSIPKNHRLKDKKEVSFQDLDNDTMLLYSNIGFWAGMHKRTMPKTKFILQEDRQSFREIVNSSTFPSFTSNLSIKREGKTKNRIVKHFSNDEARVSFYVCVLKKEHLKYDEFLNTISNYYEY